MNTTTTTTNAPAIVYLAMAGMHGCLPNFVDDYTDREEAIDAMGDLFELDMERTEALRAGGYLELSLELDFAEYVEIVTVNAADIHPDDFEAW